MNLSETMEQLLLKVSAQHERGYSAWRAKPTYRSSTIAALVNRKLLKVTREDLVELTVAGAAMVDALMFSQEVDNLSCPGTFEELICENAIFAWRRWRLFYRAAMVARAFDYSQRAAWRQSLWPGGHCMNGSLLLAPILRLSLEAEFTVVVGQAHNCQPHAWIETPAGDIIDPTYGQFDHGPALRLLPAERCTELGHMGEIRLSLDQEEHFRQSIRPVSSVSGWADNSEVNQLFSQFPSFTA